MSDNKEDNKKEGFIPNPWDIEMRLKFLEGKCMDMEQRIAELERYTNNIKKGASEIYDTLQELKKKYYV